VTEENQAFIKEVTYDKYGPPAVISGISTYKTESPLKDETYAKVEWVPGTKRCGLIARKIGQYPMWKNDGKIIWTTLLQVYSA
jgi:large subunit ribosomal protein L3